MDDSTKSEVQSQMNDVWGKISAITATKRDAGRAMVKVGGKVVVTLSLRLISELDLKVGREWTPELAVEVEAAGEFDKAYRSVMRSLERRMMTERQVRDKAREKGFSAGAGELVVSRLIDLGYLDDAAYGRAMARSLVNQKSAGPALVRQKLFQKGLKGSMIEQVVREVFEGEDMARDERVDMPGGNDLSSEGGGVDQVEMAGRLVEKKLRSMGRLEPLVRRRRLYGMLGRKGYGPDVIRQVLEIYKDEINAQDGIDAD
ncbi:regulatory protein RecX [Poriferisphaera sp. WC338]|uniref:regulatory protein RecX n=1 Tax=Poriferisphaera sp. WC338 TaxID=3425129 RepID=UPI003D8162F2